MICVVNYSFLTVLTSGNQVSRAVSERWLDAPSVKPGVFLIRYVFQPSSTIGRVTKSVLDHCSRCHTHGRMSSVDAKSFTLSLRCQREVVHFQVVNHGESWYGPFFVLCRAECSRPTLLCCRDLRYSVDNGPMFVGLEDLVQHYRAVADGLPIMLRERWGTLWPFS